MTQTTRPAKGPSGGRRAAAAAAEREAETEEEAAEAEEGCIPGRSSLEQPLLAITSTPLRAIAAGAWPSGGAGGKGAWRFREDRRKRTYGGREGLEAGAGDVVGLDPVVALSREGRETRS